MRSLSLVGLVLGILLVVTAGGALIYDRAAGSDEIVPGQSGPFVHHPEWMEYIPEQRTETRVDGKVVVTVVPARWIHHPAYDETPVDYLGGRTWISGAHPAGARYLVTITTGRLTGWHYATACIPDQQVER